MKRSHVLAAAAAATATASVLGATLDRPTADASALHVTKTHHAAQQTSTTKHQGFSTHLVGLPNQKDALKVYRTFGKKALFAFDPKTGTFRRTTHFTVPRKSTLYTSQSISMQVFGPAKTAHFLRLGRPRHHGILTTTTVAPTTTTAPAPAVTTTAQPATTTAAPATTSAATTTGSMAAPAGYSASQMFFDDTFAGTSLNTSHWHTYISDANSGGYPWNSNSAGGSGSNPGSFDAEYFEPSALSVNNGLSITASPGSNRSGYSWTSGVVETQGLVSISQGYVQVRAWMPDMSTGMWPGIWLLGENSELPEIDLYEGGYTQAGTANSSFASNLHVSGQGQKILDSGTNLAGGWHTYGIDYEPGKSISFYLDGKLLAQYTSGIPTGPYFLILNLQVAQNATGWHTNVSSATPTSTMKVAEVQMYGTAG